LKRLPTEMLDVPRSTELMEGDREPGPLRDLGQRPTTFRAKLAEATPDVGLTLVAVHGALRWFDRPELPAGWRRR
jgi:hypothetical protein